MRILRVSAALLLTSLSAAAEPAVWPQFRGPESNPVGTGPGLPDSWSKTDNVEWVAEVPGRGWSSPIVVGRKVFVTAVTTDGASKQPQRGTDYSNEYAAELIKQGLGEDEVMKRMMARDMELPHEVTLHYFLYCVDIQTGKVAWKQEMYAGHPPGGRHRKNSFSSETPVSDGQRIYVYVANLGLYAYDMKGTRVWTTPLEALPIYLDFGTGGSPVLQGDHLLILSDNEKQQFIAAFDKKTGKEAWRTLRGTKDEKGPRSSGWTTPFVWSHPLRTEIVTVGPGVAMSYDLAGKELWRLSGMTSAPVPSPFAYGGRLYVNGGQGRGLYAIKPGAAGDISLKDDAKSNEFVAWSQPKAGSYIPTQVAYDGALYVLYDKGILARFDAKTGEMTYKERLDRELAGAFTSSPWAYDGKIFCLSEEGKTYVIAAGPKFEMLRVNNVDEMALATPAPVGDRLLLRTETKLYSIRQKPAKKS